MFGNSKEVVYIQCKQHRAHDGSLLTSVERPSYLRSDFVNVRRHARLVVYIYCDSCMLLLLSKNMISVSDISAVNFIVEWKLFALSTKLSILSRLVFHSENTSSIYLFQKSGLFLRCWLDGTEWVDLRTNADIRYVRPSLPDIIEALLRRHWPKDNINFDSLNN